jgi:hypothetical protein
MIYFVDLKICSVVVYLKSIYRERQRGKGRERMRKERRERERERREYLA